MGGPASWERGRAREKRANIFGFFSFSGWLVADGERNGWVGRCVAIELLELAVSSLRRLLALSVTRVGVRTLYLPSLGVGA